MQYSQQYREEVIDKIWRSTILGIIGNLIKETKAVTSDRDIKAEDIIIIPCSLGDVVFICGKPQDSN